MGGGKKNNYFHVGAKSKILPPSPKEEIIDKLNVSKDIILLKKKAKNGD